MRQFFAAIAAALAALGTLVARTVWRAGRWITELVREPATPMPPPAPTAVGQVEENTSNHEAEVLLSLRKIMRAYLIGERPAPGDLQALPDLTRLWARQLDQRQVQICLSADDTQLSAHLRGRATIRGVIPHEAAAVAEFDRLRKMETVARLESRAALRRQKEAAPEI
jgi:hypothetical protein